MRGSTGPGWRPGCRTCAARRRGIRARAVDDAVEITSFGLLPAFIGRGIGPRLLDFAIRRGWELGPRVWVHTCSLDGPAALPNYQGRGLEISTRRGLMRAAGRAAGALAGRGGHPMTRWLVDACNVIGSQPDGWWRDREGATQRLLDALREFARTRMRSSCSTPGRPSGRAARARSRSRSRRGGGRMRRTTRSWPARGSRRVRDSWSPPMLLLPRGRASLAPTWWAPAGSGVSLGTELRLGRAAIWSTCALHVAC